MTCMASVTTTSAAVSHVGQPEKESRERSPCAWTIATSRQPRSAASRTMSATRTRVSRSWLRNEPEPSTASRSTTNVRTTGTASSPASRYWPLYAWPKPGKRNERNAATAERGSGRRPGRGLIKETPEHASGRARQYSPQDHQHLQTHPARISLRLLGHSAHGHRTVAH